MSLKPFNCFCCGQEEPFRNFEYHDMGLCEDCARRAGAAFVLAHSGVPSQELDRDAYYEWARRQRSDRKSYRKKILSATKRVAVWRRDGFACKKCGATDALTIDHIVCEFKGGSHELDNLQTLCKTCNCSKGTRAQ